VLESVPVPEVPSPREAQSPTYPALQQSPRDFSALSDGDLDDVPLAQLSADQSLQATP
jgi:hypothetical protein